MSTLAAIWIGYALLSAALGFAFLGVFPGQEQQRFAMIASATYAIAAGLFFLVAK